jgi:Domain of unknown function (DUF4386)
VATADSSANESSIRTLGGALSILAGIVFFATALAFFLLPPEQLDFTPRAEFFISVAALPTVVKLTFWGGIIGALLAIGAVIAVADYMRRTNAGLIRLSSTLAIIAFAISAVDNATLLIRIPDLATRYVQGNASIRAAIEVGGLGSLDPSLIMQSILLGLWFLSVNFLALRSRVLPRPLALIGLIYGVGALLTVPFVLFNMQVPLLVARVLGLVVLSPAWFVWTGFVLLRK